MWNVVTHMLAEDNQNNKATPLAVKFLVFKHTPLTKHISLLPRTVSPTSLNPRTKIVTTVEKIHVHCTMLLTGTAAIIVGLRTVQSPEQPLFILLDLSVMVSGVE